MQAARKHPGGIWAQLIYALCMSRFDWVDGVKGLPSCVSMMGLHRYAHSMHMHVFVPASLWLYLKFFYGKNVQLQACMWKYKCTNTCITSTHTWIWAWNVMCHDARQHLSALCRMCRAVVCISVLLVGGETHYGGQRQPHQLRPRSLGP